MTRVDYYEDALEQIVNLLQKDSIMNHPFREYAKQAFDVAESALYQGRNQTLDEEESCDL